MIQTPPFEPMPLQLRPLPYPFEALAPVLSERQVEVHYTQHHAAYVEKANAILATAGGPAGLSRAPARAWERWDFNSRGAWLHDLWWDTITPGGSDPTQFLVEHLGGPGALLRLHADLLQAGLDVQGSGWVFLSRFEDSDLRVHSSPNHDYGGGSTLFTGAFTYADAPVVVIDVWEHAYYLDYTADRQTYLERLIGLINWPMVEHRLLGRKGPGPGRKNA